MVTTGLSRAKSSTHQERWANAERHTRPEVSKTEHHLERMQLMTTNHLVLILAIEVVRLAQDVLMFISV